MDGYTLDADGFTCNGKLQLQAYDVVPYRVFEISFNQTASKTPYATTAMHVTTSCFAIKGCIRLYGCDGNLICTKGVGACSVCFVRLKNRREGLPLIYELNQML